MASSRDNWVSAVNVDEAWNEGEVAAKGVETSEDQTENREKEKILLSSW